MSVIRGDRPEGEFPHPDFMGPWHRCFLCAQELGPGLVVHWMGDRHIYLHPDCVPSLCRRMLMDWEAVQEFTRSEIAAGEQSGKTVSSNDRLRKELYG